MLILSVFITPYAQSLGNKTWLAEVDSDGLILVHYHEPQAIFSKGKLSPVMDLRIGCIVPTSGVFSVHYVWHPYCFNRLCSAVSGVYNLSAPYHLSIIMVHLGKIHCSGKCRDSGLHSSADHSVEPVPGPNNPPPIHEIVPPLSSGHKPILNSAFQTTHFKFQSNLNMPLMNAHITIILSEEENRVSSLACIAPDPSQSSEHSMDNDSPENWKSEKYGQEEFLKNTPPLEDTGLVVEEGTQGEASHSMAIPVSDLDCNESLRSGGAGLGEEKIHGKAKEG